MDSRGSTSDEQRFEQLYSEHVGALASYLRARTDRESSIDALAQTFEIAWRRLDQVPDEPKPWLFGVAARVLADQRRAKGRRDNLVQRIGTTLSDAAEDHAETLAARDAFLAALNDLAPEQREALLLVAWDGLSHREAAVALGCSAGAVAVRVHRARRRLQAAMSRHESAAPVPPVCPSPSPKEAL